MPAPLRLLQILVIGACLLMAGCASPPGPRQGRGPAPSITSTPLTDEQSNSIAIHALGLVGTPYRYGGNTPESGFDCSGLIAHVYRHAAGVASPRSTTALQDWGGDVPLQSLRSGDLVLFGAARRVTHAGIFVGNDRFVHAPSTGGQVRLERMNTPYWSQRLLAVRRP